MNEPEAASGPAGTGPASPAALARPAADLLPLVYQQLRQLAQVRMSGEQNDHTLQATALVHEVYVRLAGPDDDRPALFDNVGHFYAAAAEAMRRILIDHARSRDAEKRDGKRERLSLSSVLDLAAAPEPGDILAMDDALTRLEAEAPDAAAVVRLRFYAGLSVEKTAAALNVSPRTVDRAWNFARAWLFQALRDKDDRDREPS